jgi:hypothetical protein
LDKRRREQMKKLSLVLVLAALSAGFYAQGAEDAGTTNAVAGGSATGSGEAVGGESLMTTNAALITAGVVTAGAVAAGAGDDANATTTTTHH